MEEKFASRHSDDPNSLTTDDREVLNKKTITPTDVTDVLHDKEVGKTIDQGARVSENVPRMIFGAVLIISGILIAVITSISVIGIVIGLGFIIAGLVMMFTNVRAGAGRRAY